MLKSIAIAVGVLLISACASALSGFGVAEDPKQGTALRNQDSQSLQLLGLSPSVSIRSLGRVSATTPFLASPIKITSRWAAVVGFITHDDPEIPNFAEFPYTDGLVELHPGSGGAPQGELVITVWSPNTRVLVDCVVSIGRLSGEVYDSTGSAIGVAPLVVPYRNPGDIDPVPGWFVATFITPQEVHAEHAVVRLYNAPPLSPGDPIENWVVRHCDVSAIN